ncbi:hypothetical protein KM043_017836 [Ampulex compressa]|nr:hypothetical protein KM043_017836 [Ampulex compressa]
MKFRLRPENVLASTATAGLFRAPAFEAVAKRPMHITQYERAPAEATHVGKRSFVLPPPDCRLGRCILGVASKDEAGDGGGGGCPRLLSNWNTTSVNPR